MFFLLFSFFGGVIVIRGVGDAAKRILVKLS
jgi:hypothetical protein